jgi:hypothetical protein
VDRDAVGAPIGIAFLGTDYRFRRINDTLARWRGMPADATIGRTIADVVPELHRTSRRNRIDSRRSSGAGSIAPLHRRRSDQRSPTDHLQTAKLPARSKVVCSHVTERWSSLGRNCKWGTHPASRLLKNACLCNSKCKSQNANGKILRNTSCLHFAFCIQVVHFFSNLPELEIDATAAEPIRLEFNVSIDTRCVSAGPALSCEAFEASFPLAVTFDSTVTQAFENSRQYGPPQISPVPLARPELAPDATSTGSTRHGWSDRGTAGFFYSADISERGGFAFTFLVWVTTIFQERFLAVGSQNLGTLS